jgi:hypothetical protein
VTIKIEGTEQLERVSAQLLAAGNVELRKQMLKNIRVSVAPVKPLIRQEALRTLPRSGGANEWVASSTISVGATVSPKTATVAVRASQTRSAVKAKKARAKAAGKTYRGASTHNLKAIDAGNLRHPTFGRRNLNAWFDEAVKPGFFTRPCKLMAPSVLIACNLTVTETAAAAGFE